MRTVTQYRMRTLDEVPCMARALSQHFTDNASAMTGIFELLVNAIEHGNLAIGFACKTTLLAEGRWAEEIAARQNHPRYANRRVGITLTRDDQTSEVRITDEGAGFDWAHYIARGATHTHRHGRGLFLAQLSGFDLLQFNAQGNSVTCRRAVA